MAGLLTRGSKLSSPFPGAWRMPGPVALQGSLSAYSCGGSHGFGAWWLHLTVFPFHPAFFDRPAGTIPFFETAMALIVNQVLLLLLMVCDLLRSRGCAETIPWHHGGDAAARIANSPIPSVLPKQKNKPLRQYRSTLAQPDQTPVLVSLYLGIPDPGMVRRGA